MGVKPIARLIIFSIELFHLVLDVDFMIKKVWHIMELLQIKMDDYLSCFI